MKLEVVLLESKRAEIETETEVQRFTKNRVKAVDRWPTAADSNQLLKLRNKKEKFGCGKM